jgi:16S rRNA (uracil1498-N3)-methyltransferase
MRNPEHYLFFAEHVSKDSVIITSDECHHITKVLRIGDNDSFNVSDGNGMIFECKNLQASKHQATAQIIKKTTCPTVQPTISLFIGMPERNAFESILEASSPLNKIGRASCRERVSERV